ncbi:MAG: hypothetical protein E8D41_12935 [Nitrospira sp.]|nr:MAG: hypothetical protein E8D41_12935 [Nitrospira sp.]
MRIRNLIAVVIACLFALQCISVIDYLREEDYLLGLMDRVAPHSLPPSEQAIKVIEFLKDIPVKDFSAIQEDSRYFLLPIFSFLRPMPRQVIEKGGDCADRSRLVIRMLRLHGIEASKWALYTKEMKSVHAVVELEVETGKMVADPDFGLWFPRSNGGYYSIRDLRQSPKILHDRIQNLVEQGKRPGASDLRKYPLNDYSYEYAKTINWEKWAVTWPLYKILRVTMGTSVDDLQRPAFVETPQLMVVIIAGVIQGGLVGPYLAHIRIARRKKHDSV